MENKMSGGKMVLFLLTLFLTNIAIMADMVLVPAFGGIYETFGESINLVNFIVSGPALICIVASLISGKMMQYINKKSLMIIGFALFTIGSIFGAAIEMPYYMAFMRILVGIGWGFVNVTAIAFIADIFPDEKKRSTMMGAFNAAQAAVGALIGLIAGFIATASWQSVFKVYWISIPILAMIILFMPQKSMEEKNCKKKKILRKNLYPFLF